MLNWICGFVLGLYFGVGFVIVWNAWAEGMDDWVMWLKTMLFWPFAILSERVRKWITDETRD